MVDPRGRAAFALDPRSGLVAPLSAGGCRPRVPTYIPHRVRSRMSDGREAAAPSATEPDGAGGWGGLREAGAPGTPWRWSLFAATVVALFAACPSATWAAALALPLLSGAFAPRLFAPAVQRRWERDGLLLLADGLLVGLALVGAGRTRPWVFVGLFGLAALAVLVGDRARVRLAAGALLAMAAAVALTAAPAGALGIEGVDWFYLPVLGSAALHFAALGETARRRSAVTGRPDRAAELWTLLEITDAITGSLDVGEVMHSVVDRIGALLGTRSCTILVAQPGSPGCFVVASKGHPEATRLRIDLEEYPELRATLQTRRTVVVEDVALDPLVRPVRDVLLSKGYRSLLVLPLVFGREVCGVLWLRFDRPQRFDEDQLQFCKVAAGVSANALKNALLYRDVKETGEKLRRIVDATPDMVVATDAEGNVTEFNPGAEALTGITEERAVGQPLAALLGGEQPGPPGGEPREVGFRRADGATVQASLIGATLRGAAGDAAGAVWIGRDVTKLRRVERSLAQAERLSSLGEIVAGVAHELNNPLSSVVGYAELLRANAADPEQIQDLQRIVDSALRCQKIVMKLLSFARKQPAEKRLYDLNDCVGKVVDLKAYHLRSSDIQLELQLAEGLPRTCFDFQQIEQVILNLLNNAEQAISAVRRSGKVRLRTGLEEGQLFLDVGDDGPGVPEEIRERIFDPFFTTKELGKGTGLGLSVSYGIVREHDGRLELRPAAARGACFRVWLPVVTGPAPEIEQLATEIDRAASALRGRRVLVAEDEPNVLEFFARLLRQEGAEVTQARDGREAWGHLAGRDFDLVVADLRMPGLSGQELYERAAAERPELLRRFVFATGDLMRPETTAFLERLPNRILTKPLELETVRRVLSQAVRAG